MTVIDVSACSGDNSVSQIRRGIVQRLRKPLKDTFQIAAHRGLRWHGTPDNSLMAFRRAARTGCEIIEVDLRLTSDNHIVVFHDDHLGRGTNIAEMDREPNPYSPFTGKGYNPAVNSMPWWGKLEHALLKDEFGHVTKERLLDLEGMLDLMDLEKLPVVLFLDFKDKATVHETWKALKSRRNTVWTEYCLWKIDTDWYRLPSDLESSAWWQASQEVADLMVVPVWHSTSTYDYMKSLKAYTHKPYVISVEIGLRGPGGILQDAADYIRSSESPVRSMGWFATYGDMPPKTGSPILFDVDPEIDLWGADAEGKSPLAFVENGRPEPFDSNLRPHESLDGHDHRANIDLYRSMGYTWVITDAADLLQAHLREEFARHVDEAVSQDDM